MSLTDDSPAHPVGWWLAAGAIFCLLLAPFLLVDVPPVLDYPNHLARLYVLAFGAGDPVLSQMYQADWRLIPNLAIDLVGPPLMRVVPVDVAGRILLAGSLVLPIVGVVAYHRAVFATRSWWPLASAVVAFNGIFFLGFMNFLYSVAIAFLGAALWIRLIDRRPLVTVGATAIMAIAIFLCHLIGVMLFAVLIGSHELARLWDLRGDRRVATRFAVQRGAAIVAALIPVALLYRYSVLSEVSADMKWDLPHRKLLDLLVPFLTYSKEVAMVAFVLIGSAFILLSRRMKVDVGTAIAFIVTLAVYAVAPGDMKSAHLIDTRLPVVLALLAFAGVLPVVSARARAVIATGAALLLVVQTSLVAYVWLDHRRDLEEFRATVAAVPAGARVLVTSGEGRATLAYLGQEPLGRKIPGLLRADLHLSALLLLERHAFWPLLFADRRQQPLRILPPYDELARPIGAPPDYRAFAYDLPLAMLVEMEAPYLQRWNEFDYMLLTNAGAVEDLAAIRPDRLELLDHSDVAALYRVRKDPPAAGMSAAAEGPARF